MKQNNIRDTPKTEILVPFGYNFEDIYDVEDVGEELGKPVVEEEVIVKYGRKNEK